MAYKVSFGDYQHSGSLQATVDITGSTTVSGAVGNFGTLTVASFSPTNISAANVTASSNMSASTANFGTLTVGTFSPSTISTTDLTVTGVTTLSGNVFLGDAAADIVTVNGQITGSLFAINGGAINGTTIGTTTQSTGRFTTLSASSTLQIAGLTTLNGGLTITAGGATISTGGATITGTVNLNDGLLVKGNTQLGDSGTDTVSLTARVNTNILPTGSVTLGDAGNLWTSVNAQQISASSTIQAGGNITSNGTVSSSTAIQTNGNIRAVNPAFGSISGVTLTASVGSTLGATLVTSLSSSGNVIVGGDLTVQGTTTTVNSTTVEIADKNIIIASGSTTSLLANGSGLTLGSTGYQFNFQSSSAGTTSDFWQVINGANLTDFKAKTVFATVNGDVIQQATNLGDANGTMSLGINYSQADFTGPHTWTLPSTPSVGYSVKVKAPHNCNGTNTLTVSASVGGIDYTGNSTVVLASPDAAMELVYVDSVNTLWKIF